MVLDDPTNEFWVKLSGDMVGNGFGWGQLSHTIACAEGDRATPRQVFATMRPKSSGADPYDTLLIRCEENNGATIVVQGVGTLPGENPIASKQISNKIFGSVIYRPYRTISSPNRVH